MTSAADDIIGLYRRHARAWASDRGTRLTEGGWLDRFMTLMPGGGAVLDIGCGAAEPMASYLIAKGCTVTGVDSAPEMIDLCRARFPDGDWRVADMRSLSLPRRFDGLLAWDSFFHLCPEDQRRMFAIFRAHAAPGAALMFTSGSSFGESLGSYAGDVLYHASLDRAEYRTILPAHGFEVVAHIEQDRTCGGRTVWLAQFTK
jgi:SAM-dependent methyltransferase